MSSREGKASAETESSGEWLPENLGAALKIDPKVVSKFITQSKSKSNLVCSVFLPRGSPRSNSGGGGGELALAASPSRRKQQHASWSQIRAAPAASANSGGLRPMHDDDDLEQSGTADSHGPDVPGDRDDNGASGRSESTTRGALEAAFITQLESSRLDQQEQHHREKARRASSARPGTEVSSASKSKIKNNDQVDDGKAEAEAASKSGSCGDDDDASSVDSDEADDEHSLSTCSSESSLDVHALTEVAADEIRESALLVYAEACHKHAVVPTSGVLDSLTKQCLHLAHQLMSENSVVAFCKALEVNEYVESLDLSHNNMGEAAAEALADVIACRSTLRILSVASNHMGNDAGLALVSGIRRSRERGLFSLAAINFSNNKLTDRFAQGLARAFATAVRQDSSLAVRRAARAATASASKRGKPIAPANASKSSAEGTGHRGVVALDLSQNLIGERGAQALADALDKNRWAVRDVNMGWNVVKSLGAQYLLEASARCVVLKKLTLSWNSIDDEAAAAIGDLITTSSSLRSLDLSHNQLGAATAAAVRSALKHTTSLRTLELGFNPLSLDGAYHVLQGVEDNSSVRYLGVENPMVPCIPDTFKSPDVASDAPKGPVSPLQSLDDLWEAARQVEAARSSFVDIATEHPRRKTGVSSSSKK